MADIKYVRIAGSTRVEDYLFDEINRHLTDGLKVFWMVAGGSAMEVAVKAAERLRRAPQPQNLSITLTDERFGPVGHKDSNWRQLTDLGFDIPGARLLPVLKGRDMSATAVEYSVMLNKEIAAADYCMALAGMGADSHIFGIKPRSPAVKSTNDVEAYEWEDYKRITPTARLLLKLDEIVVYAVGPEKSRPIEDLSKELRPLDQPSQLLKQFKKVIIFNDTKGESL